MRKKFLLLSVLLLCCFYSYAQKDNADLIQDQDSLDYLAVGLKDEIDIKKNELKEEEEKLEDVRAEYAKLKAKDTKIIQEIESYKDDICLIEDTLQNHNDSIVKINREILDIDKNIDLAEAELKHLKSVKDTVYQRIKRHESYLEKAYSEMSLDTLDDIIKVCGRFLLDSRVEDFRDQVLSYKESKMLYDKALEVLESEYDASVIQSIENQMHSIDVKSDEQKKERDIILDLMDKFAKGMQVFKDFVQFIDENRSGNTEYSVWDFEDDMNRFLRSNEDIVDDYIMPVPYLEKEYNNYIRSMKENPGNAHDIESVILKFSPL